MGSEGSDRLIGPRTRRQQLGHSARAAARPRVRAVTVTVTAAIAPSPSLRPSHRHRPRQPVAPFVLYAAWRYAPLHALGGASPPALFDAAGGSGFLASGLIPREQFLAMAVGVLTHRLPLLVREAQAIAQAGAQEVRARSG